MQIYNVLSIGAGHEQIAAIKKASALGFRVVGVDGNPEAPGFQHCTEHYRIDIKDYLAVIALAKSKSIKAVIPSPLGKYITTVGRVNDELGLRGPSYETCRICSDKLLFNQAVGKVSQKVDVASIQGYQPTVAFPLVVKPNQGAGSRHVFRLEHEQAWKQWKAQLRPDEYPDGVLIEPYYVGTSLGVDAIIKDSELFIILIRKKEIASTTTILEVGYYTWHEIDQDLYDALYPTLQRAVEKIALENGVVHVDVITHKDEVVIVEMSPRPSGLHLSSVLIPLSTGVDILSEGIKLVTGSNMSLARKYEKSWGIRYLNLDAGTVARVPTAQEIKSIAEESRCEINVHQGTNLTLATKVGDLLENGYVMVEGQSQAEVAIKIKRILALFQVN